MGKWTGEEMKKHKKAYTIGIIFVLSMLICFGIGQKIVLPRTEAKRQLIEKASSEEKKKESNKSNYISLVEQFDSLLLTGYKDTEDNPWSFTIGKIEMDSIENCILMTPNTGMEIPVNGEGSVKLTFDVRIHPWVSESSDGAGLVVQTYDIEGTILNEERIDISNQEEFKMVELAIKSMNNKSTIIKILADNGKKDNDTCDWIVLRDAKINWS